MANTYDQLNAACLAFVNSYHGFKRDRSYANAADVASATRELRMVLGEQFIPLTITAPRPDQAAVIAAPKLVEAPADWSLEPIEEVANEDRAHG